MRKQGIWGAIASLGLATQALCAAGSTTLIARPAGESEEVVVRGTALWELREDVIRAEERFYARYNELNKVDDFDVECRWEAATGTHIRQRGCLTKLAVRAEETYASDFMNFLQSSGPIPDIDPHMAILTRYGEFKDNVLYLLKTNPDLRRLVRERADAVKRYNTERRKHFKGRLIEYK